MVGTIGIEPMTFCTSNKRSTTGLSAQENLVESASFVLAAFDVQNRRSTNNELRPHKENLVEPMGVQPITEALRVLLASTEHAAP